MQILSRLLAGNPLTVVAPLRALLTPVPDPAFLSGQIFTVTKGQKLDPPSTADGSSGSGYLRVPSVTVHGEFAVRGEVIDVFVPGRDQAVRILLDFDEVTAIRTFDPVDQASTGEKDNVELAPCREAAIGEEMRGTIAAALAAQGFSKEEAEQKISALIEDPDNGGVELFFPLCFDRQYSLLDYLGPEARVSLIDGERLDSNAASLRKEYLELFRRARSRKQIVPGPQKILLDLGDLLARARHRIDFPALPGPVRRLAPALLQGRPRPMTVPPGRFRATARGRSSATSLSSAKKWRRR